MSFHKTLLFYLKQYNYFASSIPGSNIDDENTYGFLDNKSVHFNNIILLLNLTGQFCFVLLQNVVGMCDYFCQSYNRALRCPKKKKNYCDLHWWKWKNAPIHFKYVKIWLWNISEWKDNFSFRNVHFLPIFLIDRSNMKTKWSFASTRMLFPVLWEQKRNIYQSHLAKRRMLIKTCSYTFAILRFPKTIWKIWCEQFSKMFKCPLRTLLQLFQSFFVPKETVFFVRPRLLSSLHTVRYNLKKNGKSVIEFVHLIFDLYGGSFFLTGIYEVTNCCYRCIHA